MSEDPAAGEKTAKPRLGPLTWALWGAAILGVAAVLYIMAQSSTKPPEVVVGPVPAPAVKPLADKLTRPTEPTPSPDYVFYDEAGKPMKIADLKGKVVVMNIWATWCAPCKAEMPTLAKLAAAYKGKDVEVVTVSIDKPEAGAQAKLFIAQNDPLKFYHDREAKLIFKLSPPAEGAPVTVIYGKDGLETARVSGEADWMGKDARALIDEALAKS
jgi:thiol-disulfide isomerase/thioredoxin